MSLALGSRFDRYQIVSFLGAGGMGEVYLATDTRLGRRIAVKLLPPGVTRDSERLRRFVQEAQAASALNHPNIITIHEIGEVDGTHFIATEYIEGTTLRKRMAVKPLTLRQSLDIAIQVCGGLVAAHAAGIIHRDLKPENIMLRPDGYIKLLDFGLAKLTERQSDSSSESFDTNPETEHDLRVTTQLDSGEGYTTSRVDVMGQTAPGVILGTAHYMSPEQARGLKVDARTDIFSLGVVLYEMISGKSPFDGTSPADVIAAILRTDPPPLSAYVPETPELLDWITAKALTKDREERYQTAREMLTDLRRINQRLQLDGEMARARSAISDSDSGSGRRNTSYAVQPRNITAELTEDLTRATGELPPRQTSRLRSVFGALKPGRVATVTVFIALVAALAALSWLWFSGGFPGSSSKAGFELRNSQRITTTGRVTRAVVSPDGRSFAYVDSDGSRQGLYIRQLTTTGSVTVVPPGEVIYRGITFSRDGNYIYYVVQEGGNPIQVLYQVSSFGGAAHKIVVDIDSPVALSPDGKRLAFVRRYRGHGEDAVIIANADGSEERKLGTRKGSDFFSTGGPVWSPDAKTILCAAGSNSPSRYMNVVGLNVDTGKEEPIGRQHWSNVGRLAILKDGRHVIASAMEMGSTLYQVWQLPFPGSSGEPRRVTNDVNDYRDVSGTDDSAALLTVQYEARVNVWVSPSGESERARQITDGVGQYNGVRGVTWMPDGRIAYISRVGGSQDIWLMNEDGQHQEQMTTAESRADVYPAVTPDGRYLVFDSTRTGNSNLWRIDSSGGNWKQLTNGPGEEFPSCSPDGKWIVYTSTGSTRFTLSRVSIDGGAPVQITDRLSQWPVVSPDGKWIACWYREEASSPWQIAVIPFDGGSPAQTFNVPSTAATAIPVRWAAKGSAIDFVDTREGVSNIWRQPISGIEAKKVTEFKSDQIFWFDWSRDGNRLACSRGSVTSDVVLLNGKH